MGIVSFFRRPVWIETVYDVRAKKTIKYGSFFTWGDVGIFLFVTACVVVLRITL